MGKDVEQFKGSDALREKAEKQLRQHSSDEINALSAEDAKALLHELQVHQIELEMQNEELRLAHEKIENSRSKYSDLYDFAPVGYFTFDKKGLILEVNLTGASLLGTERTALIEKPFSVFFLKDDQYIFYHHRQEVFETKARQRCEVRLKKKDGTVFDAQLESVFFNDSKGRKTCRTLVIDITARKYLEKQLNMFSRVVEDAPDGIQIVDLDGHIFYSNKAVENLFGFSNDEYLGKHVNEMSADPEISSRTIIPSIKEKGHWEGELIVRHKDGHEFPIWLTTALVSNETGEPIAMAGVIRDITERKEADEALKRFERVVSATTDQISMLDSNYVYQMINQSYLEYHGKKKEDIIGHSVSELIGADVFEGSIKGQLDRCLGGEVVKYQDWFDFPKMGRRFMSVSYYPYNDKSNKTLGIVVDSRDITEQKRAEDVLRKAKETLEIKVKERTNDLGSAVDHLQREIIERKKVEQHIMDSESKLRIQKNELENKNIALREIIKQIDIEKDKLRYDVEVNVKNTLLPILSKLEVPESSNRYYELLNFHLNELVSSFSRKIAKEAYNLTPREIEICNMIKGGLRSKEICELLHISYETVEKHRKNIRKKVDLTNKKENLFSFLQKF